MTSSCSFLRNNDQFSDELTGTKEKVLHFAMHLVAIFQTLQYVS